MTTTIIITVCSLLLIAYLFDLSASRTRIPSVVLLLFLGWVVRQITDFSEIGVPDLTPLLSIFGTIGLILIVLEGSLELELNHSKMPVVTRSFFVALIPMLIQAFLLAFAFRYFGGTSLKMSLVNAIPLCVISSAIAIPSVRNLVSSRREFVIFETSLSDIMGVLFFNFVALNETFSIISFEMFGLQLLFMIGISFAATVGLSLLLSRIEHHIKFAPIIILVILIYAIAKVYHLPGLIFILIFGLFLGNLDELKQWKWVQRLRPEVLDSEVNKFKELTVEATFLIRTLFFLLFGFLIETSEILNAQTFVWAVAIVAGIFFLRVILLWVFRIPLSPLVFIFPRGLITILLFFSIAPEQAIPLVDKALLIQVIILTALIMMVGLMLQKNDDSQLLASENSDGETKH